MIEELLDLKYDFVFKELFSREECRPYLATIIHICTGIDKEYLLNNMVLRNTNIPIRMKYEKRSSSDILVQIENGFINIEMNRELTKETINKNNYYISTYRNREYEVGGRFISDKVYIQINIDNYQRFKEEKFIYRVQLLERESLEIADDNLIIYHINLAYLKNKCYNELSSEEQEFLLFIEHNKVRLEEIYKENSEERKVVRELMKMWFDENMILRYDEEQYRKNVQEELLERGIQEGVEKGLQEAKEEALKEGLKQGIEQGIERGIERGIEQGIEQRNIEIAKKMLEQVHNYDMNSIAEITGLSSKTLKALQTK